MLLAQFREQLWQGQAARAKQAAQGLHASVGTSHGVSATP